MHSNNDMLQTQSGIRIPKFISVSNATSTCKLVTAPFATELLRDCEHPIGQTICHVASHAHQRHSWLLRAAVCEAASSPVQVAGSHARNLLRWNNHTAIN
jgi:hypothetical protein